jgi:hypothetical protein
LNLWSLDSCPFFSSAFSFSRHQPRQAAETLPIAKFVLLRSGLAIQVVCRRWARSGGHRHRSVLGCTSDRIGKFARGTVGACSPANLCDNLTVGDPIADRHWFCVSTASIGTRGLDTFSTPGVGGEKVFCRSVDGELTRFCEDLAAAHRRARENASMVRRAV